MDVELLEIRDFLAAHHPFDALPEDVLQRLPGFMSVRYLRRGSAFPPGEGRSGFLYIVRKGAVALRDAAGELTDKLGEGDLHADCSLSSGSQDGSGVTIEDTLCYLLPCERLEVLCRDHPVFGRHFAASQAERLERAIEALPSVPPRAGSLMTVSIESLLARKPICVAPQTSIRDAAQLMTRERISCLLVTEHDALTGLLTDRDLRSRCIAEGLEISRPVRDIMTTHVHGVAPHTLAFEALMQMTRLNVHHLPVMDGARVIGVLSASDLVRRESANAVYLVGDVSKAKTPEAIAEISGRLAELQVQLVLAGATARHVGEAVSTVNDAITVRLLQLAEQALGPPPVPYAWVAGGSHARREQSTHSDQDNALILSDEATDRDDAYFAQLARFVNAGLNACGFVYCPGDVMASNAEWRQPYRAWRRRFDGWIHEPEPMALMLSSVFFDLRTVHGEAQLLDRLQRENLQQSRDSRLFLAYMAGNALKHRPPLGFFRNIVLIHGGEHDRTFDIKHHGVVPVVDLARVYALAEGIPEIGTAARLRAVAGSHSITADSARNLEHAYEFIATLRMQHQARQLRAGEKPDNFVAPEKLSKLERSNLKDAFGIIAMLQQTLEGRLPTGRFH